MILRKVRVPAARSSRLPASIPPTQPRLRANERAAPRLVLALLVLSACGLSPIPEAATSLGSANRGVLLQAVELPKNGRGFVRARPDDDTHFGTEALVSRITQAAAQVHELFPAGSPLKIGDLSQRHGGDHSRHGSHRTGRDADVMFYLLDEQGRSIPGSGFYGFDERPVSAYEGKLAFFDTPRNWALVSALLAGDSLVQWIFCADGIKARLLAYGAQRESDPEVLLRAAYVLHQPSYGNPHRDHFHVRVACSGKERTLGCLDDGPTWPWLRNEHEKPDWQGPGADDPTLLRELLSEL
jgi:penicillin-insensitive murein endopeptidase